jgi:hypothetical protein
MTDDLQGHPANPSTSMKEGTDNALCSVENTKLQFSNNKTP